MVMMVILVAVVRSTVVVIINIMELPINMPKLRLMRVVIGTRIKFSRMLPIFPSQKVSKTQALSTIYSIKYQPDTMLLKVLTLLSMNLTVTMKPPIIQATIIITIVMLPKKRMNTITFAQHQERTVVQINHLVRYPRSARDLHRRDPTRRKIT